MNDDELDRQLAALPRTVAPPTDLWPEISARVSHRRRPRAAWPVLVPALAAALAVAVALGFVVTRTPAPDGDRLALDPALGTAFTTVVDTRPNLDDDALEQLRSQQANALETLERLTAALERRPDDPDLQRQLLHAYRGQVLHLDTLGRAPRGTF